MQRRIFILIAVFALVLGLAACGSSSKKSEPAASGGGTANITIDSSFAFKTTPVKAGATVTVKNDSNAEHTVTQDESGFDVDMPAGATKTFTAPDKAGSYKFHCKIHQFMTGTLTVT
jgi:plastocyanin